MQIELDDEELRILDIALSDFIMNATVTVLYAEKLFRLQEKLEEAQNGC